jgi:hypothetical protein
MVLPTLIHAAGLSYTEGLAMFGQESPAHVSGHALNKDLSNKASLTFPQKKSQYKTPKERMVSEAVMLIK